MTCWLPSVRTPCPLCPQHHLGSGESCRVTSCLQPALDTGCTGMPQSPGGISLLHHLTEGVFVKCLRAAALCCSQVHSPEGKRPLGLEKLCPGSSHQLQPWSVSIVSPQNVSGGVLPLLSAGVAKADPCAGVIPGLVETCGSVPTPCLKPFSFAADHGSLLPLPMVPPLHFGRSVND